MMTAVAELDPAKSCHPRAIKYLNDQALRRLPKGDSSGRISELRIVYTDDEEVPEQISISGITFRLHETESVVTRSGETEDCTTHAFYLPLCEA